MTRNEKLTLSVEAILKETQEKVQALADEYREKTLLSFCRHHKLTYMACCMGRNVFYDHAGQPVYEDDRPCLVPIVKDLNVEVLGTNDCFGYYLGDVTEQDLHD
jgi:hypothetical protein